MSELPKSVREQMAKMQSPATPHPEADLLTAYSEGSLTPAERTQIEAHLATCADCREVLFLAATPTETAVAQPVVVGRKRSSWMPVWASAAAVVMIALGTMTLLQQNRSNQELRSMSRAETAPPPQGNAQAKIENAPPESKPPERSEPAAKLKTRAEAAPKDVESADAASAKNHEATEELRMNQYARLNAPSAKVGGPRVTSNQGGQNQQNYADRLQRAPAMEAKNEAIVAATPAPPPPAAPQAQPMGVAGRQDAIAGGTAPAPQQYSAQSAKVASRQQPVPSTTETVEVTSQAAIVPQLRKKEALAQNVYSFSIGADGSVERSVNGALSRSLTADGTRFTVVAKIGSMVWAGGTGGALFRSLDDGNTWTRVVLPDAPSGDAADIQSIQFSDTRHGAVTSADGTRWATTDGGAHWAK